MRLDSVRQFALPWPSDPRMTSSSSSSRSSLAVGRVGGTIVLAAGQQEQEKFCASGAGKTTAIKTLLNLIPATRRTATLLGVDSRSIGPKVLEQIGYVPENQAMPARFRVVQFFDYLTRRRHLETHDRRDCDLIRSR